MITLYLSCIDFYFSYMYNSFMKYIIIFFLLLFSINIFPQFYISNENKTVIHPGDNLYIYNTYNISGFTIDYPENVMSIEKINNYSNRIYIGTLKNTLNPGYTTNIILNTNGQSFDLPIKIAPYYLNISINKHHFSQNDTLSGNIIFHNNNITTGNGIDSIKLYIYNSKDTFSYLVYSEDSIYDYDYSSGFFKFKYCINYKPNLYTIDIEYFSNNLSKRISRITGFYIGDIIDYSDNILIIDSNDKDFIEYTKENYNLSNTFFYNVFYYGDSLNLDDYKTVIYITDNENISFNHSLFEIIMKSNNNAFLFIKNFINTIQKDSVLIDSVYKELNIGIIDTLFEFDTIQLFQSYNDSINYVFNKTLKKNVNFIYRENKFIFFYLPVSMNIDYLNNLSTGFHYKELKTLLKDFLSIYTINNDTYNNYTIEIYSLSGAKLYSINLGYINYPYYTININDLLNLTDNKLQGIFYYKIKRGNTCISESRLLQF